MTITALQLANVLSASVVAAFALLLFFKFIADYRLDVYRQKMFVLRDELFDYAAAGHIAFDDPAYALLRKQMNALIRYGHQLTMFRIAVNRAMRLCGGAVQEQPEWHQQWASAMEEVENEDVRRNLYNFHACATGRAMRHLVYGSVPLMLFIIGAGFYEVACFGMTSVKQLAKKASARVLVGPLDPRLIEDEAVCSF